MKINIQNYKAKFTRFLQDIFIFLIFCITLFYLYTILFAYKADKVYLDLITTNSNIEIQNKYGYYVLNPINTSKTSNDLIFYPGGLVNSDSYLYKLGEISQELNIRIFVIKAPFKAAIFDINSAKRIIEEYNLDKVIVGGHSLGGISACRFVLNNGNKVEGLFLFGSYCDEDITKFQGKIISVIGQNDNIINKDNYNKAKSNLPTSNTQINEVEGLNHSDFGNYGLQKKDKESLLTEAEKIETIKNSIKQILSK